MERQLMWGVLIGLPLLGGALWAMLTPAGFIGSVAGVCIIAGVAIVFVGIGLAGSMDTAAERLLPGANLEQMTQERRPKTATKKWAGLRAVGLGLAYVAAGSFLYWLK